MKLLKNRFNLIILPLLLIQLFAVNFAAAKTLKVEEVKLRNNVLSLKHDSFGDIKFKKRIYENPPRLVFDILESKFIPAETFRSEDVDGDVDSVRVAQFEQDTSRVVVQAKTVTALEKIKIENIGQTLYFKFRVKNSVIEDITFEEGDMRITSRASLVPRTIELENPKRLVLDLIGAELKSKSQERKLKNGDDEDIRIAQFDDSIVRIVFTGKKVHDREVRISDNEKQILILGDIVKVKKHRGSGNTLKSIQLLKYNDSETLYEIVANDKLDYKFLKLHEPERLVLDLIDSELGDSFGSEPLKETSHVKNVRFGLATIGRPVTRIVFDLNSTDLIEEFKENDKGKILYVRMLGKAEQKETVVEEDKIEAAVKSKGTKIVIDAGHGGYDYGAIHGGYNEKDLNLNIARKVEKYLIGAGLDAFMTRTEDRFISLAERVEVSNAVGPKLFVSIHNNALTTNTKMEGLQTYYYSRSGYKLGSVLHRQLLSDVGMVDGKVRKANFWVTKHTKAPAVLLELGFMTNTKERKKLVRDSYQDDLAKAIGRGIVKFLEGNK